ncbi:MAG TPA: [FeFe] hydrogenase H-cluster radical SAM maturase HydE [Syntrophales bacterium]|jgi:biotin synthase|nr:[FeFe] hydrogenase H-cluster radical SAM maturase HydE [Syntrophales bacterium]
MPDSAIGDIIVRLTLGGNIRVEDLAVILSASDTGTLRYLHDTADEVRKKTVGNAVLLRGIIETSNICHQHCRYCGLRKENTKIHRYRMAEGEILAVAKKISACGISTVVLQSGEDLMAADRICALIRKIKEETDLFVTLSIGERGYEDYRAFRKAGADRYLLKHETASKALFESLRPGSSYENRRRCLLRLKELGYETGAGNLVGLPGQDVNDLAADLLYLRDLPADMIGIGPFIAHPDTPLAEFPGGSGEMTLKVVSLARLLLPKANIPATTALGVLEKDGRRKALLAGANVVMLDFTPESYRIHYDIYPGKTHVATEMDGYLEVLKKELQSIGRTVGRDRPLESGLKNGFQAGPNKA